MADYYSIGQAFPVPVSNSLSSFSGRQRHYYSAPQLELLEAEFAAEPFPSRDRRCRIAQQLNVTDKSILWWFQNRRRRIRQQTKSLNSGANKQAARHRQHRRPSPYASNQLKQDLGENWSYSDIPTVNATETLWATDYSTSESSSPIYQQESYVNNQVFQSQWSSASYPVNQEVQPNSGFHLDGHEQQHSYLNNWEYSPPFCPSSITDNPCHSTQNQLNYSNTWPPYLYSQPNCYYLQS